MSDIRNNEVDEVPDELNQEVEKQPSRDVSVKTEEFKSSLSSFLNALHSIFDKTSKAPDVPYANTEKIPFMTFSLSISSGNNLQNFDECMNGEKRRRLGNTLLSFLPKTDPIKIMFSKLIISNTTKIRNETNS